MKNKKIILLVIILVIFGGGWFIKSRNSDLEKKEVEMEVVKEVNDEVDEDELTPEEVLERLSEESEVTGEMVVEIVSPKEEIFLQSQARQYKVEVANQPTNTRLKCYWKFYLNQYDTEELYEEMGPEGSSNGCNFTQTFIKNRGKLRVVVDVVAENTLSGEEISRASAEKKYEVQ